MPQATARRSAHFIGIAGSGMRALAARYRGAGWFVSGSDSAPGYLPHAAANLAPGTQLVVHSSAIPAGNVERRAAAALGIPTLSYCEALARLMGSARGLAIAGTHGKSTVTALTAHILRRSGRSPAVVCGADTIKESAEADAFDPWLIAEACEYRRQFLALRPEAAVLTGIEWDHVDCFNNPSEVIAAFAEFAANLPAEGCLILPHDDSGSALAARGARCQRFTFGFAPAADWRAEGLRYSQGRARFNLVFRGENLGRVSLRIPGVHNIRNALAAAGAAWVAGASRRAIVSGLISFEGVRRRLEAQAFASGMRVSDYAHHPTAVALGISTSRRMFPRRPIHCLFQPHQASRTEALLLQFARILAAADRVFVAEVYAARETSPGDGLRRKLVTEIRRAGGRAETAPEAAEAAGWLAGGRSNAEARPVLLTMGAGDVERYHGDIRPAA